MLVQVTSIWKTSLDSTKIIDAVEEAALRQRQNIEREGELDIEIAESYLRKLES